MSGLKKSRAKQVEEDGSIDCDFHGLEKVAFVCQHLVRGSKLGFFHSDNGPYPDAWCGDCDTRMMKIGHWTPAAEKAAGVSVVCHRCYLNIRRCNRIPQKRTKGG